MSGGLDKTDLDVLTAAILAAPNALTPNSVVDKFEAILKELAKRDGTVGMWKKVNPAPKSARDR